MTALTAMDPEPEARDERALRQLAYRYARMIDRRDWGLLPLVFTETAHLSGPGYAMNGHAELREGLATIDRFSATMHCVMNPVFEIEGEGGGARGEIYCVANHLHEREGVPLKLDMGIRYEDRYERTGAGWRIAERVLNLVWQQELPLETSGGGGIA
ncbi:MAG: nuclear transport factor 2 family protein [bacterium]